MSGAGRNDPCPCGSGKKHKKCCLAKTAPTDTYTAGERQNALERLMRFAGREEFTKAFAVAEAVFWGEWMDGRSAGELEQAMALQESRTAFVEWFAFDHALSDDTTIVDRFLARERGRLRTGEERYLERMRLSHVRPYEVTRVRPEEGLDLRDLWSREVIRVQERVGTRQLVQWDLLATRVVLGPAGLPVVDGQPYLLPATAAAPLMKRLRRAHRELKRDEPATGLATFFKRVAMVYHHAWLDRVALRPPPRLRTTEGDDLVIARVIFDVRDRDALVAALAAHPALERQDDGSYAWHEEHEDFARGLGTFGFERGRLIFEAMSKARAERGRQMLEACAGDAVKFRATEYEGVGRALARPPRAARKTAPVPPEIEAQLVGQFYERHYRAWPETPLPALGNRTPREAAGSPSIRPKLIALLKEMEVMAARDRREGRPAYDFTWMWAELGLDRPG